MQKYLAYIRPLSDIRYSSKVPCMVTFISGDLNHRTVEYELSTDIFNYYYYGSTLEVMEFDEYGRLNKVRDLEAEDLAYFGLSIKHVLTLNVKTFDMQADNNITYNLKSNKMYNYCPHTIENIFREIQKAEKFRLTLFIIDGAVVYIQLDTNINRNTGYELARGFVVQDKSKFKQLSKSEKHSKYDKNDKMKQKDIDDLITHLEKG